MIHAPADRGANKPRIFAEACRRRGDQRCHHVIIGLFRVEGEGGGVCLVHIMRDQRAKERLLVAEALIERADRATGRARDIRHRHGIEIALGDQALPGLQQFVACAAATLLLHRENAVEGVTFRPLDLIQNMNHYSHSRIKARPSAICLNRSGRMSWTAVNS